MYPNYPDYYKISAEDLSKNARTPILVLADAGEVYYELAYEMLCEIEKHNAEGRKTVFICPFGPFRQYPIFARLVNERRVSLKNTWFINMDEYLTDDGEWVDESDPLSFRAGMKAQLYSRSDPELIMPEEQRIFPDPHDPGAIQRLIDALGGVDIAMGGIAVNGHIAFNEPQPELSVEAFGQLPTRIVRLSAETRLKTAILDRGGAYDTMPNLCITVGMKELFAARKMRLTMTLDMQRSVIRRAAHGEVTSAFPISYAQRHPNALLIISANVAEKPF